MFARTYVSRNSPIKKYRGEKIPRMYDPMVTNTQPNNPDREMLYSNYSSNLHSAKFAKYRARENKVLYSNWQKEFIIKQLNTIYKLLQRPLKRLQVDRQKINRKFIQCLPTAKSLCHSTLHKNIVAKAQSRSRCHKASEKRKWTINETFSKNMKLQKQNSNIKTLFPIYI